MALAAAALEPWLDLAARILPALWLCGVPLTFGLLATGLTGAERLRRDAQPVRERQWLELIDRLRRSLAISRHVAVGVSDRVAVPILIGLARPMILLPPAILTGLRPEQIELILLHELVHVRRWDNLVNLMQRVVESLLFFHPAVWWVSNVIRTEREHCCDDVVVRLSGRGESYAHTLAQLAGAATGQCSGMTAAAGVQAVTGSPLHEHQVTSRIRRILKREIEPMQVSRKTFAAVPIVLLVSVVCVVGYVSMASRFADADESADSGSGRNATERSTEGDVSAPAVKSAGTSEPRSNADTNTADPPSVSGRSKTPGTASQSTERSATDSESAATPGWPDDRYHGTVEFVDRVKLGSGRAGILQFVKVKLGDRVKKGDVLAGLRDDDVQAVAIDLQSAEIAYESAARDYELAKKANEEARGAISQLELQRLESKLIQAKLEAERNSKKLDILRRQIETPIDGMVVRVHKRPGEAIQPGEPIVEIVNLERVRVVMHLAPEPASQLQIGQPVRFRDIYGSTFRPAGQGRGHQATPDGEEPEEVFEGVVSFISPELKPPGLVDVYVDTTNRNERLRSGITVIVDLGLEPR